MQISVLQLCSVAVFITDELLYGTTVPLRLKTCIFPCESLSAHNWRSLAWLMPWYYSASCLMNIKDHFQQVINWSISSSVKKKRTFDHVTVPDHVMHHQNHCVMLDLWNRLSDWLAEDQRKTLNRQQGWTLGSRCSISLQMDFTWLATGVLWPEQFWAFDKGRFFMWQSVWKLAQEDENTGTFPEIRGHTVDLLLLGIITWIDKQQE